LKSLKPANPSRKAFEIPVGHGRLSAAIGFQLLGCFFFFFAPTLRTLQASDLDDLQSHFQKGDYAACAELAQAQIETGIWNDVWHRMLIESRLATGEYASALETYEKAIGKFPDSIRLRLIGVRVYQMNNRGGDALDQLSYLKALFERATWRMRNRSDLVPVGEYMLLQGEDPKLVLKNYFDQAIKNDPKLVEAHLATARLALNKNDDKVASQSLAKALEIDAGDPEILCLLARAWSSTDPAKADAFLRQSLARNPRYVPSLIIQAEALMSAEDYEKAKTILDEVERTNGSLPKLWALRAAIAHLQGRYTDEGDFRRKALIPWALNPEVDFVIGKQLSMHYRFSESAEYQRRALQMDPDYVPAQGQLAQDLLRLGELDSGWDQANQVRTKDPYDVTIFNLKQLQGQLETLDTIETEGFVIRMDRKEAKIYGQEVVELLKKARSVLTEKYDAKLVEPIYVEIFPRQKEFAIRTFGLPGGEGFLGVCFGRLITANSPAALQVDSNWQAVLWHEYCHVVTLQKTKNKMPRWLSEGISVYEERQRNPIWGQSMNETYKEMILGDDFVPMSQLSGAFLQPKSPLHLQFAYYEASLAVEYWIEKYGMQNLLRLLEDLSVGMPADEALRRAPGSLDALDAEFFAFASEKAQRYANEVDLSKPSKQDRENMASWLESHPDSVYAMRMKVKNLITNKKWDEALELALRLQTLLPSDASNDGVYAMLATIHRAKEDVQQERLAWIQLANLSADCRQALLRLLEIDRQSEDFESMLVWCERLVQIDPLRLDVQSARAQAAFQRGNSFLAIRALQACLQLGPIDPAGVHYQMALAHESNHELDQAKRQVLLALEESPRYIEALKLLAKIRKQLESQAVQSTKEGVSP
jgi:tetratricopeptide (TPR) repeat protein